MAEKWKTQDSARTMTLKYNSVVDELNNQQKTIEKQNKDTNDRIDNRITSESINVKIESPSTADLNSLLGVVTNS